MKTLIILILLLGLAAGAYYYYSGRPSQGEVQRVENDIADRVEHIGDTVRDKLKDWNLSSTNIREELDRTGKVVRKKAGEVGAVISDATADARITATIKAKLVKDRNLSALRISVSTTDGVVTLSGSAESADEISEAMKLALATEGVREVISTLQVKARNDG